MSTESSFEMYEMLLERQSITRSERLALKSSLEAVDGKIRHLIAHLKGRPRETDAELVKRLNDAEVYHSTHPQTNKDEREFMRELKVLRTKRKELVEYNTIQAEVDALKTQRSAYQRELKEKEACLDELYAGARKMRAAHKLKCDPAVLCEETLSIPQDKFSLVIGSAGSNVKKLEDECLVCIDMDKGRKEATEGSLKLFYDPAHNNVEEAKRLIQVILDTRFEEWSLSPDRVTCLLHKRAAIVMKLQEMYDVRIDISKSKLSCKVSGLSANVDSVKTAINSLEVSSSCVDLVERGVLSYILGKGRADFQRLLDEHSVDVQLDKDGSPPTATVVGAKSSVTAVTAILKQIVQDNREIEREMTFGKHVLLDAIIGTKGVIISQLQRDFNVRLTVDKDRSTATEAIIEIKGNAANVKAVMENISERISAFQSDTAVISIPEGLLAGILGKKGTRITALRQRHPEVTIDVLTESNSIRLHSTNAGLRVAAVDELEKYIAANMQKDFPMSRSTTIALKGEKGAKTRKHLTETLQLNFDIDTDSEVIHIRGRIPDIDQALQHLQVFCEENFETELACSQDDARSLLNGKDDSPARQIEDRFGVAMHYSRKNDFFRIVGLRDAVREAKQYIEDFLEGEVDTSALVSITSGGIGALVGRGGNHIKSFEKKHNVRVDILKAREQVRINGNSAAEVDGARLNLLEFLDNLAVTVSIEDVQDLWAGRCETLEGTLEDLLTQAKTMFGVGMNKSEKAMSEAGVGESVTKKLTVTFFGTPRRANAAKKFVLDELSGITTVQYDVLPHHITHLSDPVNFAKLERSASSVNVSATLSDTAIVLKGPVAFMSKAIIQINRLLDYLFMGEFSSVVTDSKTLLALWNFATELDFQTQVAGGQISFDMRMSCIRVVASTSIAHTLGVEYVRSAIRECKKRFATIEVNADIYSILSSKKSVYFGPIETKHKCKLAVQINDTKSDNDNDETIRQHVVLIEGKTESKTKEGAAAMRALIERLEKENWRVTLKGDMAGALIGKGGNVVKALREETKASINIDVRSGSVEVAGKEEHVNDAKSRILQFVSDRERDSHMTFVPITPDCIPRIIGSKGATIRELRVSSKAVSIDIDRDNNVVVVKGSVECGQKAKEDIIALLLKDNIDISKLRYISPDERKAAAVAAAAAKNAEAEKASNEQRAPAGSRRDKAEGAVAGSREAYLALLKTPGISKNSARRIRRKLRAELAEEEQKQEQSQVQQKGNEEADEGSTEQGEEVSSEASSEVAPMMEDLTVGVKQEGTKKDSPSSVVDPSFAFKSRVLGREDGGLSRSSSGSGSTSQDLVPEVPPLPPSAPAAVVTADVRKACPVALPTGDAGCLLSMILGTTPVSNSEHRVCAPRVGAPSSSSKPFAVPTPSSEPLRRPEGAHLYDAADSARTTYYRSKTGRAIRLD